MSTIRFTRRGHGIPVILIHGIGHRRQVWSEVFDRLAEDYDVIAIDLPGHGDSPKPHEPDTFALESVAAQIEQLADELELGTPHVVGNSLGGFLALVLGRRGRVASVTALSPAGFASFLENLLAGAQLLVLKAASHAPKPVVRMFSERPFLRRASQGNLYAHTETLDPDLAYGDALNLRRSTGFFPFFAHLSIARFRGDITVPATVCWADKDRILLPRQAGRARRSLPQARHVTVHDAGHVSMHDAPDAVVDVIRDQIREATQKRGSGASTLPLRRAAPTG